MENTTVKNVLKDINDNTRLVLTYADLKELLSSFQDDGLDADGCSGDLHLEPEKVISECIHTGEISILE